jgi:predicted nucleic acid-binding protein
LSIFLAKLDGLPFDERDAEVAGGIRAEIERHGKPIGAYDTLMAGQALRRGMTLVPQTSRSSIAWPDSSGKTGRTHEALMIGLRNSD